MRVEKEEVRVLECTLVTLQTKGREKGGKATEMVCCIVNREFANNVFDARIYFPLRYTSLISVCDVIS